MKSPLTTLCYIEQDGKYLMLHRVSKKNDVNRDKWIGIGGHFEAGESPEECLLREAKEETGLTLTSWRFRGLVTFESEGVDQEYMCLYTADGFTGELAQCNEGVLEWIPKRELMRLNLWEGDKLFLSLLDEDAPFFSLKLVYRGDVLKYAALDGRELELFDICDEAGEPTGRVTERSVAHTLGLMHRTAHIWIVRRSADGFEVLLQKRSSEKESYPLCYDTSAAGHVTAGDGYEETARRELSEELGLAAGPDELTYVGRFDSGDIIQEFGGKPFHDREIAAVYVYNGEKVRAEELVLQADEVDSVRWMDYRECLAHVERGDPAFCVNPDGLRLVGKYFARVWPDIVCENA